MNQAAEIAPELQEPLRRLRAAVSQIRTRIPSGRLIGVSGTLVRAELARTQIGELVELRSPDGGPEVYAEVIGLDGNMAYLAPFGSIDGLSARTEVLSTGRAPSIPVGDHVLGRVLGASGQPMARFADPPANRDNRVMVRTLNAAPPPPLSRQPIEKPFSVGVRSIDALCTSGEGQRIGIFGTAGGGKSTLVSQIVGGAAADIFVIGLIGERGREVGDFIRRTIVPENRARTCLVVSTSDRPPVERLQAALTATTIAEHYAEQGKRVLLIIDSVTRLARALRDIGLAAGEPPTRRGYPPSVFTALPRIFERAGPGKSGSITAFYTVLVEGDVMADPIAEETRSLLDGHLILSQKLASAGHYPAIDVLESRSRVMDVVTSSDHLVAAARLRELIARYREIELLIQVGEYQSGSDPTADEAVRKIGAIDAFLRQGTHERSSLQETIQRLNELVSS